MKRYRVKLSAEERQELKTLVSRGRGAAYKQTHGRVLLLSDEAHVDGAMKDEDIARVLQIGRATVERVRRRCVEEGIEAALGRKRQVNRRPKRLDGQGEAHLIALACGEPPEGRASWTLKLLADRLVECEVVESISTETVRQTLKKTCRTCCSQDITPRSTSGDGGNRSSARWPIAPTCSQRFPHRRRPSLPGQPRLRAED